MRKFIKFFKENILLLIAYSLPLPLIIIIFDCYSCLPISLNICSNNLGFVFMVIKGLLGVVAIIGPFVGLGVLIVQIKRRKNDGATFSGLVLITFSVSFFLAVWIVSPLLFEYGLNKTIKNYVPLIDALEVYKKENSHYPETLNDLVPKYLLEKFQNNICEFPENKYSRTEKNLDYETGGYYLEILPSPEASHGIYYFAYWPSRNYPSCDHSSCKIINGWYLSVD